MPHVSRFAYGPVTLYGSSFHRIPLRSTCRRLAGPTTPGAARDRPGLGYCAFARHYLRNHSYFLFLRVLRCFSSPGSPTGATPVWRDRSRRVSPFGHPRVAGHLPLAAAFRSLSRPSSPPRATGIPHAPFMSFLSSFTARGWFPFRGQRGRSCLLDLMISCRSIALSTRFLRFDFKTLPLVRPQRTPRGLSFSLLFAFPTCQ